MALLLSMETTDMIERIQTEAVSEGMQPMTSDRVYHLEMHVQYEEMDVHFYGIIAPSIRQIYQSKMRAHGKRSHWYPSEEFIFVRPLRTKKKEVVS